MTKAAFRRGRHLALAIAALGHAPLTTVSATAVMRVTNAQAWSAELAALDAIVLMTFAAVVASLAFRAFDTHAGVSLLPKRWRDLGLVFAIWWVGLEVVWISAVWHLEDDQLALADRWLTAFAPDGELPIGWVGGALLAHAAAEEIVYRGLLLRGLEGYMKPIPALLVHAAVFELIHAFVYGDGLTGAPMVAGVMFGIAFQRTRSLGVPTLLHFGHNMLLFTVTWYVVR